MIAIDTNVLLYAHRAESEQHAEALSALRSLCEGTAIFGLPVFCVGEFVRVATHRRVFDPPSTLAQALDAIDAVVGSPVCRLLTPGPGFVASLGQQLREADARGNLVFDAQIAAVCIEWGADQLLTYDRDFARFPGLRVVAATEVASGGE